MQVVIIRPTTAWLAIVHHPFSYKKNEENKKLPTIFLNITEL
jgi:hypothetical protein